MADIRISARSTLGTLNRWIEVISGNLVGSQIIGFKATRMSFGDSLVDIVRGGSGSTGNVGGINPIQIGSGGISVGGTTVDFKQGSLIQTGNNLDLSIQGNAFFTVADSSGKIIYTRAGEFSFDDLGNLVTKDGNYVLGLYDRTRAIDATSANALRDLSEDNTATGISIDFSTSTLAGINTNSNAAVNASATLNTMFGAAVSTIFNYLTDPNTPDLDRVNGQMYVPKGQLTIGAGSLNDGVVIGTIAGISIVLTVPNTVNSGDRTSVMNAQAIADAINDKSDQTGIGASVVVNLNNKDQATLVLGHVNRVVRQSAARFDTAGSGIEDTLSTNQVGLVRTFRDNKNNLFYTVNSLNLFSRATGYKPAAGDVFHFDSTGALVNDTRGKDDDSAPPFNTGVHVAISKFTNQQGLEKRRGGSQFTYTEAVGGVVVGYAGLSKTSQIDTYGVEINGFSSVGVENVVISQALESSNASVTDALPELTIAQKSFTSNTKVVNVGNTVVDDLNGLIR